MEILLTILDVVFYIVMAIYIYCIFLNTICIVLYYKYESNIKRIKEYFYDKRIH